MNTLATAHRRPAAPARAPRPSPSGPDAIEDEIGQVIVGQRDLVRQTLTGLLADGHVLLEGVPGPRQDAARPDARRRPRLHVQPDPVHAGPDAGRHHRHEHPRRGGRQPGLPLPAGADLREPRPGRRDQPGDAEDPVEPARGDAGAPGHRRPAALPAREPFFVLATQNPIEQEGTYPLPEAQLDRFLFKVMVPFPSEEDLVAIMDRTTGAESATGLEGRDGRRDRRDAAARPRGPDRAPCHRLRGQHPRRDPPGPAAGARSWFAVGGNRRGSRSSWRGSWCVFDALHTRNPTGSVPAPGRTCRRRGRPTERSNPPRPCR